MKLFYLAQVQKLLEDYDFQDKYKVMLELEETLSGLESNGKIDQDQLLEELGTPAQFAAEIIDKYNLSIHIPNLDNVGNGKSVVNQPNSNVNQSLTKDNQSTASQSTANDDDFNLHPDSNLETNNQFKQSTTESKDEDDNHQVETKSKKQKKQNAVQKTAKAPFKIVFTIITIIFFLLAFLVMSATIVLAAGLLFFIDIQTAITLFLGVLFLLLTIILSINLIKTIIYCIIEQRMKTVRIILMIIFIIVFAFLSKFMLSSTMETIDMHITNNLSAFQNMFYDRNIDISNIDWQNMDLGEYARLFGDIIKSVL